MSCEVFTNCLNNWGCCSCDDFERYYPNKTKILSPRQIRNREERKDAKKQRRNTEASKRGRSNRQKGRSSELALVKLLSSWGFECSRTPMSGSLKGCKIVGISDNVLAGDIRAKIKDEYRRIEVKRSITLSSYYKMVEGGPIYIKDFCYIMNESGFKTLVTQSRLEETSEVLDARFKKLHDYFNQDDSEIVAMKLNTQPFIFAITKKLMEELISN